MKKIDPEQIVFLGFALTLLLEFCSEKRWVMSKSNMYILISGHIPVQALTLIKVKNHALVSQVQTSLKHMKNHNIDLFFGSLLVN